MGMPVVGVLRYLTPFGVLGIPSELIRTGGSSAVAVCEVGAGGAVGAMVVDIDPSGEKGSPHPNPGASYYPETHLLQYPSRICGV